MNFRRSSSILVVVVVVGFAVAMRVSAAVELVDLSGVSEGDQIRLKWETGSETDNAGFQIRRNVDTDTVGEPIEVVNTATGETVLFVLATGDVSGAEYEVLDKNVEVGTTYQYRLEAIDITGESEFSDPISITAGETPTPTPTATATATPTPTATLTPTVTQTPSASNTPEPTATAVPQPTATNTVAASATATRTPTARPVATATPAPSATGVRRQPSPTGDRSGAAQSTSLTPTPTPTVPASATAAYPPPVRTVSVTETVLSPSEMSSPTPPTALAQQVARPEIEVPATIVQPPAGFDPLAFFGRLLTVLITMVTFSLIGVAVWLLRSS